MKKLLPVLVSASVLSVSACQVPNTETYFPDDPQKTKCSVDQSTFNSWFGGTAPTVNAKAQFADSVGFPKDNSKCDFYKWSSQMFLWLTSPVGQSYVFDSVNFFDVSPEDNNNQRTLIPNPPGSIGGAFSVRAAKEDETIGETGQAGGGGVLLSQNGSIVYYGIHVNDVYAYFLSGVKNLKISAHDFPDTKFDRDLVEAYALSQGVELPDADALTLELKTSWVDASTVRGDNQHITIMAEVPKYRKVNDALLKLDGTESKKLALVGMHIVGTVQDHPEMVWATVEHITNAPDASYNYLNTAGEKVFVPVSSSQGWEFASSAVSGIQWNNEKAKVYSSSRSYFPDCAQIECSAGDLVGYMGARVEPSLTVRFNPWGSANSTAGSSEIGDTDQDNALAENNSEIISLNNDVLSMLPKDDVRRNYFLVGAVWTQHGNIPTYSSGGPAFKQIGSLSLANSTMETYHQEIASSATTANAGCFMCHSISGPEAAKKQGVNVSHIFNEIKAIPLKGDK